MNLSSCSILFLLYVAIFALNKFNLYHLETKSEKFYQNKENYKKVQDILHNVLPHLSQFEYASDILSIFVFAYLAIMNFELFYQLGGLVFTLVLLRQFIIQITVLPKNDVCNIKNTSMFRGGCYDKIFSGHFASILLLIFILYDKKIITDQLSIILFLIFQGYIILATRTHYTIDVIVAVLVVTLVYKFKLSIY